MASSPALPLLTPLPFPTKTYEHISDSMCGANPAPLPALLPTEPQQVCGVRVAKKVTYDDRAAPHTPFFW
jgi:hypothetical protein